MFGLVDMYPVRITLSVVIASTCPPLRASRHLEYTSNSTSCVALSFRYFSMFAAGVEPCTEQTFFVPSLNESGPVMLLSLALTRIVWPAM
jgi:hypothetical protein